MMRWMALLLVFAGGCAFTRHGSHPDVSQYAKDPGRYELKRTGSLYGGYRYTRAHDAERRDLDPLFDHYDSTARVRRKSFLWTESSRWFGPAAMYAAASYMFWGPSSDEHRARNAALLAGSGILLSYVAYLLGQHEYGKLGEMYNAELANEAR